MKKFTIYCGLLDQRTKRQEITTLDAFKIATNIFVQHTGGATITEAQGVYTHDDGTIIIEPTLRCEIYNITLEQLEIAATTIKIALNQESIIIEEIEVNSKFF